MARELSETRADARPRSSRLEAFEEFAHYSLWGWWEDAFFTKVAGEGFFVSQVYWLMEKLVLIRFP